MVEEAMHILHVVGARLNFMKAMPVMPALVGRLRKCRVQALRSILLS
jgi:hypothetical protein